MNLHNTQNRHIETAINNWLGFKWKRPFEDYESMKSTDNGNPMSNPTSKDMLNVETESKATKNCKGNSANYSTNFFRERGMQ